MAIIALIDRIPVSPWWLLLSSYVLYHICRAVYLICLSPLAIFPGSKWAALSGYWEAYWNIGFRPGRRGQTLFKLEEMHKRLGSAIRMGPNEIHIYDPRFYHELYGRRTKYYKVPEMHKILGTPSSTLTEHDPFRHKQRRAPLESLFARQNVLKLEPMVMDKVDHISNKFDELYASGKAVSMEWLFKSLAIDVVSHFAFGRPVNALQDSEFRSLPVRALQYFFPCLHIIIAFPFLRFLKGLPHFFAKRISHTVEMSHDLEAVISKHIDRCISDSKVGNGPPSPAIMSRLLSPNPERGYKVPSKRDLRDEMLTIVAAGEDTTGTSIMVTMYNIIANLEIQARLLAELKEVLPAPESTAPYIQLEKLPYLSAVIKEGLRYSSPAASRTPRIVPPGGVHLPDGRFIPAGTRVGMAIYHIHYNETIFANPRVFAPDRWLKPADEIREQLRFLVPFSKGSRACLGINLAYMEMYMAIAYIVRRFELEMVDTTPRDMMWDDMVIPQFHGEFKVLTKRRVD